MTIAGHQVDDAMFTYIARNYDADTYKLLLKDEPNLTFDKSFAIQQIECRRKTRNKIPELLTYERFLFGRAISAEQCTHEVVAQFHASLFDANDRVLDMTMGLGVDDYYISKQVKSLRSIELDPIIAETGQYNFKFLSPNVEIIQADSVEYLKQLGKDELFDAIFIDPARRSEGGNRLYSFADCQPNVLELLPLISQYASRLYIKASPMLDVTQSTRDLNNYLTDVWAVSIKNECKELFFKLDFKKETSHVMLHALNHDGRKWQQFSNDNHNLLQQTSPLPDLHKATILLEPNSSIMKLGCFRALEEQTGTTQLATNSHLMISSRIVPDFPGRQFRIMEIIPFKDKEIKQLSKRIKKANIATRNFRLSTEELKKRMHMKDGGENYIFATTLATGEQVLILCEKLI